MQTNRGTPKIQEGWQYASGAYLKDWQILKSPDDQAYSALANKFDAHCRAVSFPSSSSLNALIFKNFRLKKILLSKIPLFEGAFLGKMMEVIRKFVATEEE
jgi:hypothetical protein